MDPSLAASCYPSCYPWSYPCPRDDDDDSDTGCPAYYPWFGAGSEPTPFWGNACNPCVNPCANPCNMYFPAGMAGMPGAAGFPMMPLCGPVDDVKAKIVTLSRIVGPQHFLDVNFRAPELMSAFTKVKDGNFLYLVKNAKAIKHIYNEMYLKMGDGSHVNPVLTHERFMAALAECTETGKSYYDPFLDFLLSKDEALISKIKGADAAKLKHWARLAPLSREEELDSSAPGATSSSERRYEPTYRVDNQLTRYRPYAASRNYYQ